MSINDKVSWKTFGEITWKTFGEITKHGMHLQEGNSWSTPPAGPNFSVDLEMQTEKVIDARRWLKEHSEQCP